MRWGEPLAAVRVIRRSLRDAWDALVDVAPINLAWAGLGLTIVLLPPATAALFESMHELASGRSPGIRDYIGAVRRRLVDGWAWALWSAAGLTIVGANVRLYPDPTDPRAWLSAAVAVLGILFGVSVLYVWPLLLLQPDGGLLRAIRNSIFVTLGAPLFAIVLAILLALSLAAGAVLILPLVLVLPGLICLVASHAVTDRLRAWGKIPPRPLTEEGDWLRHEPPARIDDDLRIREPHRASTDLDLAAAGRQDVPHPVHVRAVRQREHVVLTAAEHVHRRPIDPSRLPTNLDDHGEAREPPRDEAGDRVDDAGGERAQEPCARGGDHRD